MSHRDKIRSYNQVESGQANTAGVKPGLPTYTEAWALIEAARRMAVAVDHARQDDIKDRNKVRDALRLNWRLWTLFQAEMTVNEGGIPLPEDIRVNMLTLCKFVDKHTVEALKDPLPEKVATLVEINRSIASGLLASLENAEEEAQEAAASEEGGNDAPSPELANISTKV